MINEEETLTPDEARAALDSVAKIEGAGWRRAIPERWFGAGIATLIGSLFAVMRCRTRILISYSR